MAKNRNTPYDDYNYEPAYPASSYDAYEDDYAEYEDEYSDDYYEDEYEYEDEYDDEYEDEYEEEYDDYEEEYYYEPRPRQIKKKRRKRRMGCSFRFLLFIVIVTGLLALFLGAQPGAVNPLDRPERCNILVTGTDEEGFRTDTIMLLSLDRKDNTIRLLSIPRDTYVEANYSVPKINSACGAAGGGSAGMEALMGHVEDILGFAPDGYVMVDLDAFVDIVDVMGGVDFNVPQDMDYEDGSQDLYIHLKAGQQHLDGEKAMQLVRFRSGYAMADITRTEVQRQFVKAALTQWLKIESLSKIPALLDIYHSRITTDLSMRNILWLGCMALACDIGSMTMDILPGYPADYGYGSFYMPDPAGIKGLLAEAYIPNP